MTKYTEAFKHALKTSPKIYKAFSVRTKELKKEGHERISAKGVYEDVRRKLKIKMSNDLTPEYARYFMADNPKYVGFFKTNKSKVDK